jgi:lysophospholipase L1-like esterase
MKRYLIILLLFHLFIQSGQAQIRVTCIGASITEGARIANPKENSYPGQLQSLLGVKYKVSNFGVSGTTMLKKGNHPYCKTDAYQNALQSNPDIVFIDLGENDAKAINRPFYNELVADAREMIRSFKNLPSHPRIIVLLPTAMFVTDTNGIYDPVCISEVSPRLQQAASAEGVEVIDMHSLFAGRPDLVPDQIHPEEQGSGMMAKRLFQQIGYSNNNAFPLVQKYDSYKGLAMAGYQGWFSCPGDGSDRGWYHWWGRNGELRPEVAKLICGPMLANTIKHTRPIFFANGNPAYVMSEWDESTVETISVGCRVWHRRGLCSALCGGN